MLSRIFFTMTVLLLVPLALPGNPPLLDYHNHLARLSIAFEPDEVKLAFYEFRWVPVGNLGLEATTGALANLFPLETAAQITVGFSVLLNVMGLAALSMAFNGRITVPALFGLVFIWGRVLQYGFISYAIGSGLALLLFAYWAASERQDWKVRLLVSSVGCLLLYFAHVLAFVVYGLMVIGFVLGRLIWSDGEKISRRIAAIAFAGLQAIPTLTVVAILSPGREITEMRFDSLFEKLRHVSDVFFATDLVVTAIILLFGLSMIVFAIRRHVIPVNETSVGPIMVVAIAFLLSPDEVHQGQDFSANVDWRFLLPLALLSCAALKDPFENAIRASVAVCVMICAYILLMVGTYWLPWVSQERALRDCIARIELGSKVMPAFQPYGDWWRAFEPPGLEHAGAWAVTDRSAFYPKLFATEGQQPLSYRMNRDLVDIGSRRPYLVADNLDRLREYDWVIVFYPAGREKIDEDIASRIEPAACSGPGFSLHLTKR